MKNEKHVIVVGDALEFNKLELFETIAIVASPPVPAVLDTPNRATRRGNKAKGKRHLRKTYPKRNWGCRRETVS